MKLRVAFKIYKRLSQAHAEADLGDGWHRPVFLDEWGIRQGTLNRANDIRYRAKCRARRYFMREQDNWKLARHWSR